MRPRYRRDQGRSLCCMRWAMAETTGAEVTVGGRGAEV